MAAPLDRLLESLTPATLQPVYLLAGDLVLAEPAARKLAAAVAEQVGCQVVQHRRPATLAPSLEDLRTYSLFEPAKVVLVVDSAVLADTSAAALLVDEAAEVLPLKGAATDEADLSSRQRQAASRLLQALRLFGLRADQAAAAAVLSELPDWALKGATGPGGSRRRARTKKQVTELRQELAPLLERAQAAGITGFAEGDLAELASVVEDALPKGHCLILAERTVAADHPLVASLERRKALLRFAKVETTKGGGWQGLDALVAQLRDETGVDIARDALDELARRTLKGGSGWGNTEVDADSTTRFAGEYRKLAEQAQGKQPGEGSEGRRGGLRIDKALVVGSILDRGEEDVWKILDAIGAGRGAEALDRLRRMLAAADEPIAARLSFFGLLAGFCRQLTALRGLMKVARVPAGERNYNSFKSRHAAALQADLPDGTKSPVAGIHPYRLHRAYLAASRLPAAEATLLPWRVLETELMLKGESTETEGALAQLVARLAS